MSQITDSLAPQSRPPAKPGKPQAAPAPADAAGDVTKAPDPATPERKPERGERAFAEVLQADAGAVAVPAAPAAPAAPVAHAGAGPLGLPLPRSPATAGADAAALATAIAAERGTSDQAPDAGAPPPDWRPSAQPSAAGADQAPPVPTAAAKAQAGPRDGAPRHAEGAARAEPAPHELPAPVQRDQPQLAKVLLTPMPPPGAPADGDITGHGALKSAARDFSEQGASGTARLAPRAPMQDIAIIRAAPSAPAATNDGAAPMPVAPLDLNADPQPVLLGSDRQNLIAPARAMPAAAGPMPHHPPPPTPEAVLAQISTHLSANGRSEMTLRLDPPELGLVRIGLSMGEGHVTAVISADRPDIDGMLRRHAAQLSAALQEAGYKGVDLSFDSGSGGTRHGAPDARPAPAIALGGEGPPAPSAFVRLADTDARPGPAGGLLPGDGLDLRL